MTDIDIVDKKIVDLLIEDGRMTCAAIARRIGNISERMVRYRLDRLVQDGMIRISAIANPRALGFHVVADIWLEVESDRIQEVAQKMTEYECVSYVACSIGETDVSVQIVARDTDEAYRFVIDVIRKTPGVRKTTTSIVPSVLKDVFEWQIPTSTCASPTTSPED